MRVQSGRAGWPGRPGVGRGPKIAAVVSLLGAASSVLWFVGDALAQRIVAGRPYAAVDDLKRVSGIGARSLDGFRPFVVVSGESRRRDEDESC